MKRALAIGLLVLSLTACTPHQVMETKPVTTSADAPRDNDHIIARFTNDIWPAINAKNGVVAQGGHADQQFHLITDGDVDLNDVVQSLGIPGYRTANDNLYRDPTMGLQLANVALTAVNPPSATLDVCYTYTLIDHDKTVAQPTAAHITAVLHKTDAWYLHNLTDNHVVPSCLANNF